MSNIVPFSDMQQMATAIAKSGIFGIKDEASVLALMAVAQSDGSHPAKAMQEYHIIQGRPALKADAMMARFQSAGGKIVWKKYEDDEVIGIFSHPSGGSLEVKWTIKQAQSIGLVKPSSGWVKYPRAMLRARCISEGIRSVFPGVIAGFYTPEEVSDFEPPKEKFVGGSSTADEQNWDTSSINKPEFQEAQNAFKKDLESLVSDLDAVDATAPSGQLDLYVPGQKEAYKVCGGESDWMYSFVDMAVRIFKAAKLPRQDRLDKYNDFKEANKAVMEGLSSAIHAKLHSSINLAITENLESK
jgi:hypothetical protein